MSETWTITFDTTISDNGVVVGRGGLCYHGTWPAIYPELDHRYRLLALRQALERRPR